MGEALLTGPPVPRWQQLLERDVPRTGPVLDEVAGAGRDLDAEREPARGRVDPQRPGDVEIPLIVRGRVIGRIGTNRNRRRLWRAGVARRDVPTLGVMSMSGRTMTAAVIGVLIVTLLAIARWTDRGEAQTESFPALAISGLVEEYQSISARNIDNFVVGGSCDDSAISGLDSKFQDSYRVLLYSDDHSLADVVQTGAATVGYVGSNLVTCEFPFTVQLVDGQRFVQLAVNRSAMTDPASQVLVYTRDEVIVPQGSTDVLRIPAPEPSVSP